MRTHGWRLWDDLTVLDDENMAAAAVATADDEAVTGQLADRRVAPNFGPSAAGAGAL
jgi:hypothetical protein